MIKLDKHFKLLQPLRQEKQPARVRLTRPYSDSISNDSETIILGQRERGGAHTDMNNGKQLLRLASKNTHTCVTGVHVCACISSKYSVK